VRIIPWEERLVRSYASEEEDMWCMKEEIEELRERVSELEEELAAMRTKNSS